MNKIELKFKDRIAIDRGTYFLFSKKNSIDFIKECKKENIDLLGIDGFYKIDDETIQPSMEHSIDFSSKFFTIPPSQDIYDTAIEFINNKADNLYFEIVCE